MKPRATGMVLNHPIARLDSPQRKILSSFKILLATLYHGPVPLRSFLTPGVVRPRFHLCPTAWAQSAGPEPSRAATITLARPHDLHASKIRESQSRPRLPPCRITAPIPLGQLVVTGLYLLLLAERVEHQCDLDCALLRLGFLKLLREVAPSGVRPLALRGRCRRRAGSRRGRIPSRAPRVRRATRAPRFDCAPG